MIEIADLVIGHGACDILAPLNLQFKPGEFVAIVGANGAGKTTLLRTIAGLLPALAGNVRIDGTRVASMRAPVRARKIAFVDSETPIFGRMLVRDVVAMGRLPFRPWWQWSCEVTDMQAIDEALNVCALQDFAAREFATLSSGERQRVWIASAFAQSTASLLLDEPTSRLDIRYAIDVLKLLRAAAGRGAVVAASMHDLERAALFADRIIVMGERRILADGPPPLALTEQTLEAAYGVKMEVRHESGRVWLLPYV